MSHKLLMFSSQSTIQIIEYGMRKLRYDSKFFRFIDSLKCVFFTVELVENLLNETKKHVDEFSDDIPNTSSLYEELNLKEVLT